MEMISQLTGKRNILKSSLGDNNTLTWDIAQQQLDIASYLFLFLCLQQDMFVDKQ